MKRLSEELISRLRRCAKQKRDTGLTYKTGAARISGNNSIPYSSSPFSFFSLSPYRCRTLESLPKKKFQTFLCWKVSTLRKFSFKYVPHLLCDLHYHLFSYSFFFALSIYVILSYIERVSYMLY